MNRRWSQNKIHNIIPHARHFDNTARGWKLFLFTNNSHNNITVISLDDHTRLNSGRDHIDRGLSGIQIELVSFAVGELHRIVFVIT